MDLGGLRSQRSDRLFYGVTLAATSAQILFGLLLFFTLPAHVISARLVGILALVFVLVGIVLWLLWQEVRADEPGKRFHPVVAVLLVLVSFMVLARHEIRETAIAPHRALVAAKTAQYQAQVAATHDYLLMPGGLGGSSASPGSLVFTRRCASCHSFERRLVGPALNQALAVYRGNPQALMGWITKPGRKRADYPVMPAQEMPRDELQQLVEYVFRRRGKAATAR